MSCHRPWRAVCCERECPCTVKSLCAQEEGCAALSAFMASAFCEENLLFATSAEEFLLVAVLPGSRPLAESLFARFLDAGADFEVAMPAGLRRSAWEALQEWRTHAGLVTTGWHGFSAAVRACADFSWNLIEREVWPHYIASEPYLARVRWGGCSSCDCVLCVKARHQRGPT